MKTRIALSVLVLLLPLPLRGAEPEVKPVAHFISRFERWRRTRHFRMRTPPGPSREECLAALPQLRAVLKGEDAALKKRSLFVLCWMYPLSDGSAPALIARLSDPDTDIRTAAAFALGAFLPDAELVAPALRKALADKEATVREGAALSLGRLGPNGAAALPELDKQADADRAPLARAAAVEAILRIDAARGAKRLLTDLDAPVPEARIAAAWGVRLLRPEMLDVPKVAAALSRIVADEKADHRLRYEAFMTISRCFAGRPEALRAARVAFRAKKVPGVYAPSAWPYALLGDSLWAECGRWRTAFGTDLALTVILNVAGWPLTPEQLTELCRPGIMGAHRRRASLLQILARRGKPDMALVPRLVELVNTTADGAEREWAMRALVKSPMRRDELARLAAPYAAKGERCAIEVLGECGAAARKHIPRLLPVLQQPNPHIRRAAAEAIAKVGTDSQELVAALADTVTRGGQWSRYDLKLAAARALARCGKPGVAKLAELMSEKRPLECRKIAVRGLGNGGPEAAPVVPKLIELMQGGMPLSALARDSLTRLGSVSGPLLVRELTSDDGARVYKAAIVFKYMGERAAPWRDDILGAWRRWRTKYGDASTYTHEAMAALGATVAPELFAIVEKGEGKEATHATHLIRDMDGPALAGHVDRLEKLAKGAEGGDALRQALAKAYAEAPGGRPKLLALMADPSGVVRREACRLCSLKKWRGDDVVAALAQAARLGTHRALSDLAELGPTAKAALPALLAIARDTKNHPVAFRLKALMPIAKIGRGEQGLDLIRGALLRDTDNSAQHAANAIRSLPWPEAAKLAPHLRAVIERKMADGTLERNNMRTLVWVLGYVEPTSEANHRLYQKMAQDGRPDIARMGQSALKNEKARPERVAWLSWTVARAVRSGRARAGDHLAKILQELAWKKGPRAIPALRLAAASAPSAELRSLATQLLKADAAAQERQ